MKGWPILVGVGWSIEDRMVARYLVVVVFEVLGRCYEVYGAAKVVCRQEEHIDVGRRRSDGSDVCGKCEKDRDCVSLRSIDDK